MCILLNRRVGGLGRGTLPAAFWKIVVAAGVMGIAVAAVHGGLEAAWPHGGLLPALGRLMASIATGVAVLAGVARVLGIQDWNQALQRIGAQLQRLRGRAAGN